jgi:hypothetical protein
MSKSATAVAPARPKVQDVEKAIGEIHPDGLKEITYRCANEQCDNEQVIRYFANLSVLPVTCCVKCRAGFGVDVPKMIEHGIGMFPIEGSERRFER